MGAKNQKKNMAKVLSTELNETTDPSAARVSLITIQTQTMCIPMKEGGKIRITPAKLDQRPKTKRNCKKFIF